MSRAGFEPATPCLKVRPWQHILLVLRGSGPAESASVHLIREKLFTKLFTRERGRRDWHFYLQPHDTASVESDALAISARVAPSLRLIRSRNLLGLASGSSSAFGFDPFRGLLRGRRLFAFGDFLLAFAFFVSAGWPLVVSCVLIVDPSTTKDRRTGPHTAHYLRHLTYFAYLYTSQGGFR
jgi:hypothetical protein